MLQKHRVWLRLFRSGFVAITTICLMSAGQLPNAIASGNLTMPTTGTVTQLFLGTFSQDFKGKYYDQNDQLQSISTSVHEGVDIARAAASSDCVNDHSAPVYAAGAGKVISTKYLRGWGWSVEIQHGLSVSSNGRYVFTLYAHMGTRDPRINNPGTPCITVSEGQLVSAGQLIGYQGSSGKSTGTHLHWSIKVNPSKDSWKGSYWASPDFYTCMALTQGDSSPLNSVNAGQNSCAPIPPTSPPGPSVIATIPVGTGPNGIAVNENTNRIYVTNYADNTVSVIDGNINSVIATVPVGAGPSGIGVNPATNKVYVVNRGDSTISVINGNTNNVTSTIPVNNNAFGVGINPNTNRIYVSVQPGIARGPYVEVIDGVTDSVVSTIPCGITTDPVRGVSASYCSPSQVVVDPSTGKVYVHDYNANVVVIDNTDTVVSAITGVGAGSNDYALGINPISRRLYVGHSISLNVPLSVVNLDTQETVVTVPLSDGSLPMGIGVNTNINHIYIAMFNGTFLVLDGATNTFLGDPLPISGTLSGVAVNTLTNRVYVTNSSDNKVLVIADASP